jgi:transcription elongation factor S-II
LGGLSKAAGMTDKVKKELLTLSSSLGKTEDVQRITDILETLSSFELTYPLLKETKIGQTVSKYRKHQEDAVSQAARQLLKSWKKLAPSTPRSSKETESWGEEKPKSAPQALAKPPPADGMRNIAYKRLLGVFSADELYEETETQQKTIELEQEMHDTFQSNKKGYKEKYMQLILNLKKNDSLRTNVMNGETPCEALMDMTSEQMQTQELRDHLTQAKKDIFDQFDLNWLRKNEDQINKECNIKDQSGIFRCSKCGSENTNNYQKQTRSADEPMTV